MYDFCLKDDGKMSEFFKQYQDFLGRWRATKPATARRSRVCSSGTSASKKFRYCLKNEGYLREGMTLFLMGRHKKSPPPLFRAAG